MHDTVQAELDALRAEVRELRDELTWRRAHVCPVPTASSCTCFGSAMPSKCPVHPGLTVTGYVSPLNVCAGAAGYHPVLTFPWYNGAAAQPLTFTNIPTSVAAGCAAPQVLTFGG